MINKGTENIILNQGILRTPLFSFNKTENIHSGNLREIAGDPLVQEALLLASPSFFNEVLKWLKGEITEKKRVLNIERTLYKYISRASTRSTPFGLFGATSFIEIKQKENSEQEVLLTRLSKFSRIDICSMQLLIDFFNKKKELRKYLKYSANNSIYPLGNQIRYFELIKKNNFISFELSSVSLNEYLNKIINFCRKPRTLDEIINTCFKGNDFSEKEILLFLFDLIDSNLLISELEIVLSETDSLKALIQKLQKIGEEKNGEGYMDLTFMERMLNILKNNVAITSQHYKLKKILEANNIKCKPEDLLHIDAYRHVDRKLKIERYLLDELLEAKKLLLKLSPKPIDRFKQFKKNYERRYGEKSMQLLEVLDPEAGIGYTRNSEDMNNIPLLENIHLPKHNLGLQGISLSANEVFLLNKLLECHKNGCKEISLEYEEVQNFPIAVNEPHTMDAVFSLLKDGKKVHLELFSGSSGINFLSRFAYMDERILNLCKDIAEFEQGSNADYVLAEIIHLPELKSGNLLLHKEFRDYQIPIVTKSNPKEKRILLSDIQIRVLGNAHIDLFSRQLNKPILPKLSNTLNYGRNSIDIFRFLSDLQLQYENPVIQFDWYGIRELFGFYPRVNYKNIILSPAFWIIQKKELSDVSFEGNFEDQLLSFRKRKGIPEKVYLSIDIKDDNKLFIDFTNKLAIEVFKKELTRSNKIILSEVLTQSGTPVVDDKHDFYNNEIVLPVINANPINQGKNHFSVKKSDSSLPVQDIFFPGTEWVYFKIYAGPNIIDELLNGPIGELACSLHKEKIVTQWFFVRYSDEDFHLRVRFLLSSPEHLLTVIHQINSTLQPYKSNSLVHNVVIDAYKREIERYSPENMELCERIFSADSFAVCDFLNKYNEDKQWLFGLMGIDGYLNDFGLDVHKKMEIMGFIAGQFFKEFSGNKKLKFQLDQKYRKKGKEITLYLNSYNIPDEDQGLLKIMQKRTTANKDIIDEIMANPGTKKTELSDLISSIIHMFLNRLFRTNHRKQELVLYYMLWKHYKSEQAQSKIKQ